MPARQLHVVHVISGLGQGGAEAVLNRLLLTPSAAIRHTLVSFTDDGLYGAGLRDAGINVITLGMKPGKFTPGDFLALRRELKRLKPDVVQTWMYHADAIAGLAARTAGIRHIAWGIRNSGENLKSSSKSAWLLARACGLMSGWLPQTIVCCAQGARARHEQWGYEADKMVVIQNGYDLTRWQPDTQARARLREQWQLAPEARVIGFVARFNPLKDHHSLIQALAHCKKNGLILHCVLVGKGLDTENAQLMQWLREADVTDQVMLLGMRDDVPAIMNALDVHVLSSLAEGFPNVVAEAMACGVPGVVTDVGDAALIVGDTGWVVPPQNPVALGEAIGLAFAAIDEQGREAIGARVRERVLQEFSLPRMVERYEQTWQAMVADAR
ncbi:glycosyltransferase family 4 protein [Advenella mimigardefordensis]|uniref:Putative glycosyltransferase, family 1 n=1 Tax=Advenella mimigardefordensis (strain DSM 17166 / LMG 22922 / DPN7) TaxID=1247726 RepID=W0PIM1_ADVMD|nr:glycosyltransferase [Advenella mimigardefordensis]AHG65315.1 putative glycosyltransferase, family 1 [Advenella mimigardefordensis DPN7]